MVAGHILSHYRVPCMTSGQGVTQLSRARNISSICYTVTLPLLSHSHVSVFTAIFY